MPVTPEKHVFMGETIGAGLPIRAPIGDLTIPQRSTPGAIRWRKKDGCFVLEQYGRVGCCGFGWYEVPCLMET